MALFFLEGISFVIKFSFNKDAAKALARELRRASWAISFVSATVMFTNNSWLALIATTCGWVAVQAIALIIESIDDINFSRKNK